MIDLRQEVEKIAKEAGTFILNEAQNFDKLKVQEKKGFSDLVSYVDKQAEKMIVESLSDLDSSFGFIAEEGTGVKSDEWNWIIDPLDGTTNFIHNLPAYSVSIALSRKQELQIGVIYDIVHDQMYSAELGLGATCNGQKISVSNASTLQSSLIATGFPYYEFEKMQEYLAMLESLMQKTQGIRRMGSAAIDLAYTAAGKFEAFFEYNLNPWDVAAGILLVREAGGIVTDFNNGNDCLFGRQLLAGSPAVHAETLKIVQQHWKG